MSARLPARLCREVATADAAGRTRAELGLRVGLTPAEVDEPIAALCAGGELVELAGVLLDPIVVVRLEATVLAEVAARGSLPRAEVAGRLPAALAPGVAAAIVDGLLARGAVSLVGQDLAPALDAPGGGAIVARRRARAAVRGLGARATAAGGAGRHRRRRASVAVRAALDRSPPPAPR
ncbi:MAG: hypothetical protein R2939_00315 [Kofleriaceae bacterium]